MEMTAVLWILYAFILPQFGILSSGKEIFSRMFNRATDNKDPMAHNPLKSTMKLSCGVEYDQSQIPDVSHLDMLDHDSNTDKHVRSKRSASAKKFQRKIIEVAVFVDSAFYFKYRNKASDDLDKAVFQRVRKIMEQAQLYYSHHTLDIKFKLETVKIEIMKPNTGAPNNYGGNSPLYLQDFCRWQSKLNKKDGTPGHWDHAALITGMHIFNYVGSKKHSIGGMTDLSAMCDNEKSCSISEGTHYESGSIVAHEIAHTLGAHHDGEENYCDKRKYFMGGSNLNWSPCSNSYINNFIRSGNGWCLADDTLFHNEGYGMKSLQYTLPNLSRTTPTLNEQCRLSLGPTYSVFQDEQPPYNDVCRELWCKSEADSDEPQVAYKALDGSPCGENMHCMEGSCRPVHSDQKS